jgi:hypothetical protein
MIGSRGPRILQAAAVVAGMALAIVHSPLGMLPSSDATEPPAGAGPTPLLATVSTVQREAATGDDVDAPDGQLFLLTRPVTDHNPGHQPATFVIARRVPTKSATARPAEQSELDPALDDAWRRYGCHLNPGNPSCLTVGLAAGCATDAIGPGCSVDSDDDRCPDVAEVEAGLDPFDDADCVGSAGGQPAINCLFPTENLACNGDRIADSEESTCTPEGETLPHTGRGTVFGCDEVDQPPSDACVSNARDPGCDGFAPESG